MQTKSDARVAASEEFTEIQRIADSLGERIKDTRQSLLISDVIKEREDLLGLNSNGHGMAGMSDEDDGAAEDKPDTEEQSPEEKLVEAVLKDAYIKESMAILVDLAEQRTEIAGKAQK